MLECLLLIASVSFWLAANAMAHRATDYYHAISLADRNWSAVGSWLCRLFGYGFALMLLAALSRY